MKLLKLFLFGCLLSSAVYAQNVSFYLNAEDLTTDDILTYTVELTDLKQSRVPQADFPDIKGFAFGGSMTSNRNINGRISISLSANYFPQRTGNFNIPSIRYRLGGKTYDSPKFKVRVKKGTGKKKSQNTNPNYRFPLDDLFSSRQPQRRTPKATDLPESTLKDINLDSVNRDYFLTYHLSNKEVYIGEQLKGEVVMYVKEEIDQRIKVEMESIFEMQQRLKNQGFFQEIVDVRRFYPKRVLIDGETYVATVLYKVILFPIRTGPIALDETYLEANLYEESQGRSPLDDFFGSRGTPKRVKIEGPAINIASQPLPAGGPEGTSMVGVYKMGAEISQQELKTGEAIELKVTIQGTGHPAMMQAPQLNAPESFQTEEPSSDFSTNLRNDAFWGEKTFNYVLTPTQPGNYNLGPLKFYYFNSEKMVYDSLTLEDIPVRISGDAILLDNNQGGGLANFYQKSIETSSKEVNHSGSKGPAWLLIMISLMVGGVVFYNLFIKKGSPVVEKEEEYDPLA